MDTGYTGTNWMFGAAGAELEDLLMNHDSLTPELLKKATEWLCQCENDYGPLWNSVEDMIRHSYPIPENEEDGD